MTDNDDYEVVADNEDAYVVTPEVFPVYEEGTLGASIKKILDENVTRIFSETHATARITELLLVAIENRK
jgi:hypothetical protein